MNDIALLRLAGALARHSADRHQVIGQNVANADTPGYRARDLRSFETVLRDDFATRATRAGHMTAAGPRAAEAILDSAPGADSPNGNNVSVPDQIIRATEAAGAHNRAVTIYQKTMDIMRIGLGRGR